jgi:hypothetical protein
MYEMEGFSALDALADAMPAMIPVGLGAVTSFGVAEAINFLVPNEDVVKWKWLIALGGVALVGALMWSFRGEMDGLVTLLSGGLFTAAGYGVEALQEYKATRAANGNGMGAYPGRFQLFKQTPLYQGLQGGGMGEFVMSPSQPLPAGYFDRDDIVQFQGQQPMSPAIMV